MTNVSFVRTRTYYQPYDDLFRLAELSGYPVIYLDEMDVTDASQTYIFSPNNGETASGWPGAKAHIIFMQMEWHTNLEPVTLPPGVAECWNGDKWHSQIIGARFVPLGSDFGLNLDPRNNPPKKYDVAFMAYTDIYRRKRVYDQLIEKGFSIAPNGWGIDRHNALLESRCIVHVHQWENIPTIAPLRWCIAAAYRLPIISEAVNSREPFGYSDFMVSDYEHLVEFVTMHLKDPAPQLLTSFGYALQNKLCRELTFRKSIEAALGERIGVI